jgi:drug/metabolite transporter (DMT)-like permease
VRLADVEPATAAFFRCFYALPAIAAYAIWESRRATSRARRERLLAVASGVVFAADLELWHHGIAHVGAGLSTVISNTQVIVVGLVAWVVLGERPSARTTIALPIAIGGVVLISGIVGSDAYGEDPLRGAVFSLLTALAYAGYLLLIRASNPRADRPAGAVLESTAACAVCLAVVGIVLGELHPLPTWPAHGWLVLLALSAQAFGGIAIATALPRLPAVTTSIILLAQPVLAVVFASLVVDEHPSGIQVLGIVLVIGAIVVATSGGTARRPPTASQRAVDRRDVRRLT